ncbi:MAG: cytochrome C oxidase subunit IV family protein [Candidatus Kapaibacterium sp.]
MEDKQLQHEHTPHPGYGLHILVWLSLLSLTAITVSVAGLELGDYTLFVALFIAAIKSALVITIFMHIKFEDLLFKVFLLVVIATLAVVFIITGFDIFTRGL